MSRRPAPLPSADPRQPLHDWASGATGPSEAWARLAWVVFALFVAMVLVLGARPGGPLPPWIFVQGRLLVGLAALAVLILGLARSLRRPPLLGRRRLPALVALVLVLGIANAPFPYPSSRERSPSAVDLRLPVEAPAGPDEGWRVLWGGDEPARNRLAELYPDRRFGLHLVLERGGASRSGVGRAAADHLAFGRPVLAPAAGRVVRVHAGEPDREGPGRVPPGEPLGNLVVIEVAPGEYLHLTNLRSGSIRVEEGQLVATGQVLAQIGWSGASGVSSEPHLALHLSTDPRPRRGEGIPLRFVSYLSGGRPVERGAPKGGLGAGGERLGELVSPAKP